MSSLKIVEIQGTYYSLFSIVFYLKNSINLTSGRQLDEQRANELFYIKK
jgi:hypothetical protein